MELTIRPVISCAGHDTLVAELEDRCLASISNEPVMWNHSRYRPPYPVCLRACFSRFNIDRQHVPVKILFTGRPIRPLGTLEPLVYLFIITNNVTSYNFDGGRTALGSWLGQLQSRNVSDWLILVVNADTQSGTPKLWHKSNVTDKIKSDFKLNSYSHHILQLPDSRSVDERTFVDAWVSIMRTLRRMILEAYYTAIQDYNNHLSLLTESRTRNDWDFMEFVDRKEDVAYLHTAVGAYEDALAEYDELAGILLDFATVSANSVLRFSWINKFMGSGSDVDINLRRSLTCCPPIRCDSDSAQRKRVRDRTASVFDLATYILARQYDLLSLMNRLDEFAPRAFDCISSTMQSARNFGVCSQPLLLSCWTFLTAINSLELMFAELSSPDSERQQPPAMEDILLAVKCILAIGFGSIRHPYDESFEALFPDDDLMSMGESYRPTDNVLLNADKSDDNPLALPLAYICHFLYSAMIATVAPVTARRGNEAGVQTDSPFTPGHIYKRRPHLTRNYLVQLWHLTFTHLTLLGQHGGQQPQLLAEIMADLSATVVDRHVRGQWTARLQQQLDLFLPTSGAVFTEVFVAVAQVTISLFRLVDQPTNAVSVAIVLGGYMQSLGCSKFATYLYDSAFVIYRQENWPELTGFAHLRLASCLRALLKADEGLAPELLIRYFYSCLALASSSQSCFELLRKHHVLKQPCCATTGLSDKLSQQLPLPYPTLPANCYSTDFWWLEVIALQELLPPDFVWEASWDLSSPFRIEEVRLDGGDEAGYQLITISIDVTSEASYFQVSLVLPARHPTREDWQTVLYDDLHCGETDEENGVASSSLPPFEVDLGMIRGRPKTRPAPASNSSGSRTVPPPAVPVTVAKPTVKAEEHLGWSVSGSKNGTGAGAKPPRAMSSLLDAAAAIATRTAWRSQGHLTEPNLRKSASERRLSYIRSAAQNRSSFPTLDYLAHQQKQGSSSGSSALLGAAAPDRLSSQHSSLTDNRAGVNPPVGARKRSVSELKSRYSIVLEKPVRLLQQPRSGRQQAAVRDEATKSCFFVPYPSGNLTSSSLVVLAPGLNTVQLVASLPGFYLPETVRLGVIRRAKNVQLASVSSRSTNPQPLFKISYSLRPDNFDAKTWANASLLDSLLPQLSLVTAVTGGGPPVAIRPVSIVHGLMGFRNAVDAELVLGRLTLDNRTTTTGEGLSVTLYRCLASSYSPGSDAMAMAASPAPRQTGVKAPNEYIVNVESSLAMESDRPKRMIAGRLLEPLSSANFVGLRNTEESLLGLGCRLRLDKPLWLTASSDKDRFLVYMPFGNFKRLPVEIIRPFVFTLKLHAFQDTDILFFINIACMDMLDTFATVTSTPRSFTELTNPNTFRLANFEFKVVAPSDNSDPAVQVNKNNAKHTKDVEKVDQQQHMDTKQIEKQLTLNESVDESIRETSRQLPGTPIDPEMSEVSVNRLQPASLLWRFKLAEFRPFIYTALENSKHLPLIRFTCSVARTDDPKFESQLVFERQISPGRSDGRQSTVTNPLNRPRVT